MKKIGNTEDGNVLLEATRDEYLMLCHLATALEGKPIDYLRMRDQFNVTMPDFYGVFGAIEAFAVAHYRVNELQDLLNQLKRSIDGEVVKG